MYTQSPDFKNAIEFDRSLLTNSICLFLRSSEPKKAKHQTPNKTLQIVFLKLLGGTTPQQIPKTNKKTLNSHNANVAENKSASVKPASNLTSNMLYQKKAETKQVNPILKLSGTKCIKAHARTDLQSPMRMMVIGERVNTGLYGQENKTATRKDTASNRLYEKKAEVQQVTVNPTSKLSGMKRLGNKETHVSTNLKSSVLTTAVWEERKNKTLYGQERKEKRKEISNYNQEKELEKIHVELKELNISHIFPYRKKKTLPYTENVTNPYRFR